jgi:hypothetical protein
MQQIADWLNKLGMSEYAERFTEKWAPEAESIFSGGRLS